jgi:hypothetical protein
MRGWITITSLLLLPGIARAGHTRPGYVDGCQSADGRYVVTAEPTKDARGEDGWRFTWKDTKTGETHTGRLVGVPQGLDHFRVAYTHIFVPPGGETFAVWQPASWAPCDRKPPGADPKGLNRNPGDAFRNYAGFADRLVVYKKTGEVVKRLSMNDILRPDEWIFVNWVHGNLYWLTEYPDVMQNGEPPRCGWRYYRVSPDYSVLEFVVGPNADARHKVRDEGPEVANHRRTVRISLTDGAFLDASAKPSDPDKVPVRPFVGGLVKRGAQQRDYVPSLDPVRTEGRVPAAP